MTFSFLSENPNRHLITLFAYLNISDLEIIFMLQGFLIFALHCMRNTQVRKNMKQFINSILSFSVSIDIRLLVLRTLFRVARLSAD